MTLIAYAVPVTAIESDAVVTSDGTRHPADVLIFGTGFATTDFLSHIPVTGTDGRLLSDAWSDGAHAYLGSAVAVNHIHVGRIEAAGHPHHVLEQRPPRQRLQHFR